MTEARVPRLVPGGTVLCIASGPSLTREDVDLCQGKVDAAIAINTSYQMAPWADVLYACDVQWWRDHDWAQDFAGMKFARRFGQKPYPHGVQGLRDTGSHGLELDPTGIRTGRNSGYQALNVAVHLGAARILLLGYDMSKDPKGRSHWHPPHRTGAQASPYDAFRRAFESTVEPLRALGIEVINCSRRTELTTFPRVRLEDALARPVAVSA